MRRLRSSAAVHWVWLLMMLCAGWASADEFETANQQFEQGRFADARSGYQKLVEAGDWSANLFYNLGNAELRAGSPGRAILQYERALTLDPTHAEAASNLALARAQTGARTEDEAWWKPLLRTKNADLWTWIAAASGWVAIFGMVRIAVDRRPPFAGWILALALLLCAYASTAVWQGAEGRSLAIVTEMHTTAKLAPADSAGLAESLPPGSRVQILSERGAWVYCALPSRGRGWIPQEKLARVWIAKS